MADFASARAVDDRPCICASLSDVHRHEGHRVIAKDVHNLHGNCVTSGPGINVGGGFEFEFPIFARAKALSLILENITAGPALLEIEKFTIVLRHFQQLALHPHSTRDFDDFLAAFKIKIHGPVVHPVGPLLRQYVTRFDAFFVFADFDEFALFTDDFAFARLQFGGDAL